MSLGGVTVLFQLLELPVRPRPMLPKSIRGGLAERINPALLAIVAVSLAVHGSLAYWLYQRDLPARTTLQRISARAALPAHDETRAIVVPATLIERLEPAPPPAPGTATPAPRELRPRRGDRVRGDRPGHGGRAGRRALDDARIRELVDGTAAISVLTGGVDGSSRYGQIASKDPGGELDRSRKAVANSGREIVTRRPRGLQTRDGGSPEAVRRRDVGTAAPPKQSEAASSAR